MLFYLSSSNLIQKFSKIFSQPRRPSEFNDKLCPVSNCVDHIFCNQNVTSIYIIVAKKKNHAKKCAEILTYPNQWECKP